MRRVFRIVAALPIILVWSASTPVFAGPIIISYDIVNANLSGLGGWAHTYSGTITPTGPGLANYTGGAGTLNDGTRNNVYNSQLFDATSGPVITLYLDDYYAVSSISVFGGDFSNAIPGLLETMYISFGGTAYQYSGTPFGFQGPSVRTSDLFTITGPLSGLVTNQIVLSGFGGPLYGDRTFSIAEIEVAGGGATPVADPGSTLLLFGIGLAGLRAWRKGLR